MEPEINKIYLICNSAGEQLLGRCIGISTPSKVVKLAPTIWLGGPSPLWLPGGDVGLSGSFARYLHITSSRQEINEVVTDWVRFMEFTTEPPPGTDLHRWWHTQHEQVG